MDNNQRLAAAHPHAIIDPDRLAYIRATPADLLPVPGPGGRPWLRVPTSADIRTLSAASRPNG
jgi:hypothetical protein